MLICGLKLTHDGSVAVMDDDRLVFSVEVEKLNNNARYSPLEDLSLIPTILDDFGYKTSDIDQYVIDGWDGKVNGHVNIIGQGGQRDELLVAPYHEDGRSDPFVTAHKGVFSIGGKEHEFRSYFHVTSHLTAAYATSPFAAAHENCIAVVWDGGMFPRLYFINTSGVVEPGGSVFPLIGHVYATAGHHFGPWKRSNQSATADDLSVAGKLMAYIALGKPHEHVISILREEYEHHFAGNSSKAKHFRESVHGWGTAYERSVTYLHAFYESVASRFNRFEVSDEMVLASVHVFLQRLLLEKLKERIRSWKGDGPWNLVFSGGCALNIKWNSALRDDPIFSDVWVPPFPNDSGAALGAATACFYENSSAALPIDWSVRSGPRVLPAGELPAGWTTDDCSIKELAEIIHTSDEPVVVLNGRAEIGPRALGGRSIIAAPTSNKMKQRLNDIKGREHYRPVAPLCLEEYASEIFSPGTRDPYMLFEHRVRPDWVERIPAVMHLDGTARLQTVSETDDPVIAKLLREYRELSGVPVLCNTSANLNGSGFFPDVLSVINWGYVDRVWSAGIIYRQDCA